MKSIGGHGNEKHKECKSTGTSRDPKPECPLAFIFDVYKKQAREKGAKSYSHIEPIEKVKFLYTLMWVPIIKLVRTKAYYVGHIATIS